MKAKQMLGKLFGKKEAAPAAENRTIPPALAALKQAIEEKRKTDPLIGAKLCADALIKILTDFMSKKDPKGVHLETLLVAIASVGGFACQMAIREGIINAGKATEKQAFVIVGGADGKTYYFGDTLNQALLETKNSLYAYAAGGAQHAGAKKLPDLHELCGHVSSTVGSNNFGIPRYPEGHNASDSPYNWVKALWPNHHQNLLFHCASPMEWPAVYGIAIQKIIIMAKGTLNPEIALQIAMEAAIPMSKIDYKEIVGS